MTVLQYLYERHGETGPAETVSVRGQRSSARQHHSDLPAQEISDPPEESFVEERRVEPAVLPLHLVGHQVVEELLHKPALQVVGWEIGILESRVELTFLLMVSTMLL